jgi:hypothetical protein
MLTNWPQRSDEFVVQVAALKGAARESAMVGIAGRSPWCDLATNFVCTMVHKDHPKVSLNDLNLLAKQHTVAITKYVTHTVASV